MPNHVQNKLQIIGTKERVIEIFSLICNDDGCLDFDKIIPCPQIIKDVGEIHHGIVTAVKAKYMVNVSENPLVAILELSSRAKSEHEEIREKDKPAFEKACIAYEQTGYCYWYDWNIDNWGTKWGAYRQPDKRNTEDTKYFQTAWSAPTEIMNRLTELYPDVTMKLWYADEDSGCNTGLITCKDGFIREDENENLSIQAYDLFFDLHPDRKEDYEFVDGTYQYKEK